MKRSIALLVMLFLVYPALASAKKDDNIIPDVKRMNYSWASDRIHKPLWGIAVGDLNGDGIKDTVLLERSSLSIGKFQGTAYEEVVTCEWPGDAKAAKIDLYDLDADGDEEIIVTAVDESIPSSIVMDYENDGCQTLMKDLHWSLRKVNSLSSEGEILVGQWWNSHEYFTGPIFQMKAGEKKFSKGKKLALPWRSKLYDFTISENVNDKMSVVLQKDFAPLQLRKYIGKKYKKIWQSTERYGGSINMLSASTRKVLGEEKSQFVTFEVSPTIIEGAYGQRKLIAVHQDMPLKSMIGRKPYIRSSYIAIFNEDRALGFVEDIRTVKLPGAVVDYAIDNKGENGARRLFVLVLEGIEFFEKDAVSAVFAFDVDFSYTDPSISKGTEKK